MYFQTQKSIVGSSQLENSQQKPANLIENVELNTSMHH